LFLEYEKMSQRLAILPLNDGKPVIWRLLSRLPGKNAEKDGAP
jgi:hypothetical protein